MGAVILGEGATVARPKLAVPTPPGMDEFIMPGVPPNVKASARFRVNEVSGDVYMIADRLRELNPRLGINVIEDTHRGEVAFNIVEEVPGKGPQLVFRCRVLDARVVEHVRYLIKVPFERRFEEAERIAAKHEADSHEAELDDLTERIGLEMQYDFKRLGFADGHYNPGSTSRRAFGRG